MLQIYACVMRTKGIVGGLAVLWENTEIVNSQATIITALNTIVG